MNPLRKLPERYLVSAERAGSWSHFVGLRAVITHYFLKAVLNLAVLLVFLAQNLLTLGKRL